LALSRLEASRVSLRPSDFSEYRLDRRGYGGGDCRCERDTVTDIGDVDGENHRLLGHLPKVIWATQVLEQLAKSGLPSRAEISDAAMGERAECVMLNKGPHIGEAVVVLDDILCRMAEHHYKKNALLRQLHSWRPTASGA
jgi:hypothetical protein